MCYKNMRGLHFIFVSLFFKIRYARWQSNLNNERTCKWNFRRGKGGSGQYLSETVNKICTFNPSPPFPTHKNPKDKILQWTIFIYFWKSRQTIYKKKTFLSKYFFYARIKPFRRCFLTPPPPPPSLYSPTAQISPLKQSFFRRPFFIKEKEKKKV